MTTFVRKRLLGAVAIMLVGCVAGEPSKVEVTNGKSTEVRLQQLLDQAVTRNHSVHGAVLGVNAPRLGLKWIGASGLADPTSHRPMDPGDPFRLCSVTKPLTATILLRLTEAPPTGKAPISVNDKISKYLTQDVMKGLHVINGVDYSGDITIDQLGRHMSGLTSLTDDPKFMELIFADPGKLWTPREVLQYSKDHVTPRFPPGQGWSYSDTGYLLLGLIIENYTGMSLQDAYRKYVYEPAGMHETWMEFFEDPPSGTKTMSHVFYGDYDYTGMRASTAGWGAGGLASTVSDLDSFIRALATQKLFTRPETWKTMTAWVPADANIPNVTYGFGLFRVTGKYGEIIGHTGACKSVMNYWVEGDVSIVATLNQWNANSNELVSGVLKILASP